MPVVVWVWDEVWGAECDVVWAWGEEWACTHINLRLRHLFSPRLPL